MPTDHPLEPERIVIRDETHAMHNDFLEAHARHLRKLEAEIDERAARSAHERALRPRLRWLVDHPRLLDWAYRLKLATRPTMPMRLSTTNAFDGLANVSADFIRARESGFTRDA